MNYEFSLNKTAVVSLIAGPIVIGILLFCGGLVVGSQWLTSNASSREALAKNEQPDVPAEPVLNDEAAAPKAPKKVNPDAAIPKPAAPASLQQHAVPQPPAAQAVAAHAIPQAQTANGGIEIIQEAAADAPAAADSEPEYVTVQVGAFLNQDDANRLLKDMERKGYSPSFFSGHDAEARQWFAVRIGAYSDRQQAAS